MDTRNDHGLEVLHEPAVSVSHGQPEIRHEAAQAAPRSPAARVAKVLAGVLVGLLVAAFLLLWLLRGGGDDAVRAGVPVGKPAAVQELGLTVSAPETAVAGQAASFTVAWTDGTGVFSGTTEEWGDGVGASSLSQAGCPQAASSEQAGGGTYDVSHTFTEPGTYSVVLGVSTYTCQAGAAVTEDASRTLQVEVLPAG